METRILIGIDPAMRNIGLACMKEDSKGGLEPVYIATVTTQMHDEYLANLKIKKRFVEACTGLERELLSLCASLGVNDLSKVKLFIELPIGSKDANAAYSLAFSSCLAAYLELIGFNNQDVVLARDVKYFSTKGNKLAEKREIIESLFKEYPQFNWQLNKQGEPLMKNEHKADAIGAILAGLAKEKR